MALTDEQTVEKYLNRKHLISEKTLKILAILCATYHFALAAIGLLLAVFILYIGIGKWIHLGINLIFG